MRSLRPQLASRLGAAHFGFASLLPSLVQPRAYSFDQGDLLYSQQKYTKRITPRNQKLLKHKNSEENVGFVTKEVRVCLKNYFVSIFFGSLN